MYAPPLPSTAGCALATTAEVTSVHQRRLFHTESSDTRTLATGQTHCAVLLSPFPSPPVSFTR